MITEVPVAPGFIQWQHLAGGLCGSLLFCAGVVLSEEKGFVSLLELQYLLQIASCEHCYSGMTTWSSVLFSSAGYVSHCPVHFCT